MERFRLLPRFCFGGGGAAAEPYSACALPCALPVWSQMARCGVLRVCTLCSCCPRSGFGFVTEWRSDARGDLCGLVVALASRSHNMATTIVSQAACLLITGIRVVVGRSALAARQLSRCGLIARFRARPLSSFARCFRRLHLMLRLPVLAFVSIEARSVCVAG